MRVGNLIQSKPSPMRSGQAVFIILKVQQNLNYGLSYEEEFFVRGTNYRGEETSFWMRASDARVLFEVIA